MDFDCNGVKGKFAKFTDIEYMEKDLFENGKFVIKPASYYIDIPEIDISNFCHKHALYNIPTTEQVEYLKDQIGNKYAIEIGSGNGVLAEALGIKATDSKLQDAPAIKQFYNIYGQNTIKYGDNVQKIDANTAVATYKPDIIIATWVTHRFEQNLRTGNAAGINECQLLKHAKKYIHIGNHNVHFDKPIRKKHKYTEHYFNWLLSKKGFDPQNVVWIFER